MVVVMFPIDRYFEKVVTPRFTSQVKNYIISLVVLVLISLFVFVFIFIMHYHVKALFSIKEDYNAADLTSSIIMAIATVIYVVFTAFIFYTTNENTKQVSKSQKIGHIENQFKNLYMPLEVLLRDNNPVKLEADIKIFLIEWDMKSNLCTEPNKFYKKKLALFSFIKERNEKFIAEYTNINQFRYLLRDKSSLDVFDVFNVLSEVYNIVIEHVSDYKEGSYLLFADKYDTKEYEILISALKSDVKLLKGEMSSLLNS